MDVIETIKHTEEYWMVLVIFMFITIVCLSAVLFSIYVLFYKTDEDSVGYLLIFLMSGCIFASITYKLYIAGPGITYKATITDFNEVYESGYKIVNEEEGIYTLKKNN